MLFELQTLVAHDDQMTSVIFMKVNLHLMTWYFRRVRCLNFKIGWCCPFISLQLCHLTLFLELLFFSLGNVYFGIYALSSKFDFHIKLFVRSLYLTYYNSFASVSMLDF